MGRKYLTEAELEKVRANPYVAKASAANISYTADFKRLVRRELLEGKNIMDIFRDAGFDVAALGWPRISHFKQKIMEFADPDFKEKGKLITKEAPLKESTDEDDIETLKKRVRWLEHQLAYIQQEVEFVKKNSDGRYGGEETMGIETTPEVKFSLIYEATKRDNNMLSISEMCRIAGVSRSGYYAWLVAAPNRQKRDESDAADFDLIMNAYRFRGYAKGARGIHMRLLHVGTRMNLKKIRRLMKKYGLVCPIRKANPYRRMASEMGTSNVADNIVKREFHQGSRKVLLTDITYIFFDGGRCYLSTILDAMTHEILAYKLSESLDVSFVIQTVVDLVKKHGCALDNETIIHSDQGCHYTSRAFIQKLKDEEFVQSMSRRGNCWDNAPQESFFGHMKDEIAERISHLTNFSYVRKVVDDWMDYYNNDRYQWDLLKLSPTEYFEYLTTGIYPLPVYERESYSRGAAPNPEV